MLSLSGKFSESSGNPTADPESYEFWIGTRCFRKQVIFIFLQEYERAKMLHLSAQELPFT